MSADVGKLVLTVADAAAAAAELGAGAGAVDGDAAEDGVLALDAGVPVGDEAGPAAGEPLGADAGAGAAAGRAGTVSTAPTEEAVPLMGPDNPSGKKPPVPFWLPSTAMLTTCRPNVVISWHA
jgi:hypothetical protein